MKAEIVTSFERDNRHFVLLEVEQEQPSIVKDGRFETMVTTPISIRCPEIDDFKIKAWIKNEEVNFEISYHEDHYRLKFREGSCVDFNNLELFQEDIQAGVFITVYLTNLFACAKNGFLDYKIQLLARCKNADHRIGNIKDTIKL